MCGIAGFADSTFGGRPGSGTPRLDAEFNLVHRMCEVIRHRGPDDEGIHVEPGLGLGMRRLSIIDLAGGRQPIHNEVEHGLGRLQRRDLQLPRPARGARTPRSRVLHVQRHGIDRPRLRGVGRGRLPPPARHVRHRAVGRDRRARCCSRAIAPARSPCTTPSSGGRLYFGSEIKSLLAAGAVEPALNLAALDHYLAFLYTPRDASIFEGVRKLPPGHFLRWRDGRARGQAGTWQVGGAGDLHGLGGGGDRGARRCSRRTRSRSHLMADVPLGAFLSGGVDSSAVVGMMARARRQRAGEDVLDRLRRPRVRRAGARAHGRAAFRHRSPRVRRPSRRAVDPRRI